MSATSTPDPLTGFTIGVTAARRADEFAALLERRGATVMHAPAIRIIPLVDDDELRVATESVIANPPDIVVATTGIGFRGWIEAADGWGLADELIEKLSGTRLLSRGPKSNGAIRAAGLREQWSPPSESSSELISELLEEGVNGKRVGVQLHGATTDWEPLPDLAEVLREAGATIIPIPVYRWVPPDDPAPMSLMIDAIVGGEIDAVTFTSAPAVASMLGLAQKLGVLESLLASMRTTVPAICVGNVTAGPLHALSVPTMQPTRFRLGALARLIAEELPRRAQVLRVAGHHVSMRAASVVVDGTALALTDAGLALMKTLTRVPGQVVSRQALLDELPGGGTDTHAVEMAVTRLRSALGNPKMIQTVVKRGYRLAVDLEYDEPDDDD
ncbi:uroporphyrinogen-III synthase [Gordonia sp. CPCC 205515]|uniref:uroporphyrinogen-III synthase n=1 Tax=Gordonia sp. CPCC 205515 TaxID=3140791 RepID=UPI003AF34FD3